MLTSRKGKVPIYVYCSIISMHITAITVIILFYLALGLESVDLVTQLQPVSGGFILGLQGRHGAGIFRERSLLQKRSGVLSIEGSVRDMG